MVVCDIMAKPAIMAKNKATGKLVICEKKINAAPKMNRSMINILYRLTSFFRDARKTAPINAPNPIELFR